MKYTFLTIGIALALALTPTAQAQVNYHQAQQAGKVWRDKAQDNRRKDARNKGDDNYFAALTERDISAARSRHSERYLRMKNSVGKENADRWLEAMARADRANK